MTRKAQIARAITEVDVFCDAAATAIRSNAPIGFGPQFSEEANALDDLLADIPKRFARLVRAGQRRGWATK